MAPTPTTAIVDLSVTIGILRTGVSFAPVDLRSVAAERDRLLERRLDELVPVLMRRSGLEGWVIDAREYNEDPVAATMLPSTWLGTARRRTLLVFRDYGEERAAISRYPVGPFPSVWDPSAQPDQWQALADYMSGVMGPIGIDISDEFPLADGLSSTEHVALVRALDEHHLESAERVAVGWLETRLDSEVPIMKEGCRLAHQLLQRALSDEVIVPGTTSTEDVAWWLAQTSHDSGLGSWFHPGVTVQRRGTGSSSPADVHEDRVIERADLVHIDFGIVRHGYHTDQQQHAYVLNEGEAGAPASLTAGMRHANRLQDILIGEMVPEVTGNDALSSTIAKAQAEGIRPVVYTHPIGLHGHAAGSTIGLWDNQEKISGEGDYPIGVSTAWSIELAVEIDVDEWDGQTVRLMLEEDAFLGAEGIEFLDGRQEELWLIE
jgi:hypothetical protein